MRGFPATHLVCLPGRRWDCYWCRQPRCRSAWRPRSWAGWPRTLCHPPICSASRMLRRRARQKGELFIRRGLQLKYINFHGCGDRLLGSAAVNDCFGFYQDVFSWDCCIHENKHKKRVFRKAWQGDKVRYRTTCRVFCILQGCHSAEVSSLQCSERGYWLMAPIRVRVNQHFQPCRQHTQKQQSESKTRQNKLQRDPAQKV